MDSNNNRYIIPEKARIGHVHLKVSDLERSLAFYCGLLGFNLVMRYGKEAAFVSAGDYHHHIGLNVWYSSNAAPPPRNTTGLYHVAILYPERKDLAAILFRLQEADYPFNASDHGVSEAIYINDPDKNGLELSWDRPKALWPRTPEGLPDMYTNRLDIENLLKELTKE
jgi:catechol 2,3-dioxygenase